MVPPFRWTLVVNSDLGTGMTLVRRLEHLGHHATLADDGAEALRLLECDEYDVVLLDAGLPDGEADDVLAAMTRADPSRRVPVVVTGVADGEGVAWVERGADGCVADDVLLPTLQVKVDAALAQRRPLT